MTRRVSLLRRGGAQRIPPVAAPATAATTTQVPAVVEVEVVEPEPVPVEPEPPFTITIQSEDAAEDDQVNANAAVNDVDVDMMANNNAPEPTGITIKSEPMDYEYEVNAGISNLFLADSSADVPTITIQSEPENGEGGTIAGINDIVPQNQNRGSLDNMVNSDDVIFVNAANIKEEQVDFGYEASATPSSNDAPNSENVTFVNTAAIKEEEVDFGYEAYAAPVSNNVRDSGNVTFVNAATIKSEVEDVGYESNARAGIDGLIDDGIISFVKYKDTPNFPGGSDGIPGVANVRIKTEPEDEYEVLAGCIGSDSAADDNSQRGFDFAHNFTVSEALEELQEHLVLIPTIGKIKGKAFVDKLRIVYESYYPSMETPSGIAKLQTIQLAEGTTLYSDVTNFKCLRFLIDYMDSGRYLLSRNVQNANVDNDLCDLSLIMEICREYFDATKAFLQMKEQHEEAFLYTAQNQNANFMQDFKID